MTVNGKPVDENMTMSKIKEIIDGYPFIMSFRVVPLPASRKEALEKAAPKVKPTKSRAKNRSLPSESVGTEYTAACTSRYSAKAETSHAARQEDQKSETILVESGNKQPHCMHIIELHIITLDICTIYKYLLYTASFRLPRTDNKKVLGRQNNTLDATLAHLLPSMISLLYY
jgi:hypothetical protein